MAESKYESAKRKDRMQESGQSFVESDDFAATPADKNMAEGQHKDRNFSVRDINITRQEAEIREEIKEMKDACTRIQDDDKAVQCLSETKQFEDRMSDIFRPESNKRKMERVSQEEELQVL